MRNCDLTNAIKKWKQLRIERIVAYNSHPKLCKYCNNPIPYDKHKENIFCNTSCAASYNNKVKLRKKKFNKCKICGTQISHKNTFCSQECINKSREPKFILNFKNKLLSGDTIYKSSLRAYMILSRDYKCNRCGISNWQGHHIPLECHHIDGVFSHNNDDNLELLCPNCHSITHNYRGRNRSTNNGKNRNKKQ